MKPQTTKKRFCFYPSLSHTEPSTASQTPWGNRANAQRYSLWPDVVVRGGVKSKQEAVSHTWWKTVCLAGFSPSIISLANYHNQSWNEKPSSSLLRLPGLTRDAVFSVLSQDTKQIHKHRPIWKEALWSVVSLNETDHVVCTKQAKTESVKD